MMRQSGNWKDVVGRGRRVDREAGLRLLSYDNGLVLRLQMALAISGAFDVTLDGDLSGAHISTDAISSH